MVSTRARSGGGSRKHKVQESVSELQLHGRLSKRSRTSLEGDARSLNGIFPLDVWLVVADFIPTQDTRTLSVLSRVSKTFYQNLSPRLYRDVVAAAPSNSNLPGFRLLMQRFLSITQRKAVAAVHPVHPSTHIYPDVPDEDLVPYCTPYAKRMLVGWSNPGADGILSVTRYIEEALVNLTKIEALVWLDKHVQFSNSVGNRLKGLNLKAFAINMESQPTLSAVKSIRDLTYLDIYTTPSNSNNRNKQIKELLLGSKDSLGTLVYEEGNGPEGNPSTGSQMNTSEILLHNKKVIRFPKLSTLCVRFNHLGDLGAKGLLSSIDFSQLTYLEFSTVQHEDEQDRFSHDALFKALLDSYGPKSGTNSLALKTLRLRSRVPIYPSKTFLTLLSSFDTLRTFVFEEGGFSKGDPERENMDGLLSALETHKNLAWLAINVPIYTEKRWQFTTEHVVRLRDSFPQLTHLVGSFVIRDEEKIFAILPSFKNLVCLALPTTNPTANFIGASPEMQMALLTQSLLPAFLRELQNGADAKKPRRWEDKYKLSRIVLSSTAYEVASKFPGEDLKARRKSKEVKTEDSKVRVRPIRPEQLYEGEFSDLAFIKPYEWRARNYDASRGDWFQGIKL